MFPGRCAWGARLFGPALSIRRRDWRLAVASRHRNRLDLLPYNLRPLSGLFWWGDVSFAPWRRPLRRGTACSFRLGGSPAARAALMGSTCSFWRRQLARLRWARLRHSLAGLDHRAGELARRGGCRVVAAAHEHMPAIGALLDDGGQIAARNARNVPRWPCRQVLASWGAPIASSTRRRLALVVLVAVDLLNVVAGGVEERVVVLVRLFRIGPSISSM